MTSPCLLRLEERFCPPNRSTPKTVVLRGSFCLPFLIMRLLCRAPKKLREESPVRRFSKMEAIIMFERYYMRWQDSRNYTVAGMCQGSGNLER